MRIKPLQNFRWSFNGAVKEYYKDSSVSVNETEANKMIDAGLAQKVEPRQEKHYEPEMEDKMLKPGAKKTKRKTTKKLGGEDVQ